MRGGSSSRGEKGQKEQHLTQQASPAARARHADARAIYPSLRSPSHLGHALVPSHSPAPPLLLVQSKQSRVLAGGRRGQSMGQRKFRLSDMIPNAWFYKLRDMRAATGRGRGAMHQPPPPSSSSRGNRAVQQPATPRSGSSALPHRASYYYTTRDREAVTPPRPAAKKPTEFVPLTQSPPRNSRRRHRVGPVRMREQAPPDDVGFVPAPVIPRGLEHVVDAPGSTSRRRRDMYVEYDGGDLRRPTVSTAPADDGLHGEVIASKKDIVIDLRAESMPERVLRPIVTRPVRRQLVPHEFEDRHVDLADMTPRASSASEKSSTGSKPRRSSVSSSGRRLKTRANSPRLAAATARKAKPPTSSPARSTRPLPAPAIADSFAVVKTSEDPRRDFLESMEEMIAEKGIRDTGDLEDLLACYLSLNAAEYHDLIVEVFEQIWTSLANVRSCKRP